MLVFAHFASVITFETFNADTPSRSIPYGYLSSFLKETLNLGGVGLGGNFGFVAMRASMTLVGSIGSHIISIAMILITLEFAYGFLFSTLLGRGYRWSKKPLKQPKRVATTMLP